MLYKAALMNLIGIIFDKLLVISKGESVLGGQKKKRFWGTWNCKCDCGKEVTVKTVHLTKKQVRSCGCLIGKNGKSIMPGTKFSRLTTLVYKKGSKWLCQCDCENIVEVTTDNLISKNTKSCGCLKIEISRNKIEKVINARRKFEPKTASARRVWKSYCYRDNNCDITFEQFLIISQQNCFYCGINPNNKYNYFKSASSRGSINAKKDGEFSYNGLDRIDSSKSHIIDNIVSCCYDCNRAKNNRSIKDFLLWVNNLTINQFKPIDIINVTYPENSSLKMSINSIFYNHKKDTDLTIEEYYSISQMKCFYCNSPPNNICNKAKNDKRSSKIAIENGNYIYNGIDRVDRSLLHNKNNIVPCCKYCNFAKSKLTLLEFQNWIIRIKEYKKHNAKSISTLGIILFLL